MHHYKDRKLFKDLFLKVHFNYIAQPIFTNVINQHHFMIETKFIQGKYPR
jgi:hypothetical protein